MRVLVAEDSPSALKMIERVLTSEGHEIEAYVDGNSAIEAIEAPDSPQICILDWMMPGLSGLEITERITQNGYKEDKYILILSAKSAKEEIARILYAGADDYVTKPMNRDEFLARVKVAERTILYQNELLEKSRSLEKLLNKHNLLNTIASTSKLANEGDENEKRRPCYTRLDDNSPLVKRALRLDAIEHFEQIFVPILGNANIHAEALAPPEDGTPFPELEDEDCDIIAWQSIIIESLGLWLDIVVDAPLSSAQGCSQAALGADDLPLEQTIAYFSEIIGMIEAGVRTHLQNNDIELHAPFVSRAFHTHQRVAIYSESPDRLSWRVQASNDDFQINCHIFVNTSEVNQRIFNNLRPLEVLAANITPSDRAETILMKKGEVLTRHKLRYIERWTSYNTIKDTIQTITPSLLTQKLHRAADEIG